MPSERFIEPSRVAVAAKVHGGLDGAARFDEGERVFQPQASGDGFAGLAIMACAICRKKVLMGNPLNVLVGI